MAWQLEKGLFTSLKQVLKQNKTFNGVKFFVDSGIHFFTMNNDTFVIINDKEEIDLRSINRLITSLWPRDKVFISTIVNKDYVVMWEVRDDAICSTDTHLYRAQIKYLIDYYLLTIQT